MQSGADHSAWLEFLAGMGREALSRVGIGLTLPRARAGVPKLGVGEAELRGGNLPKLELRNENTVYRPQPTACRLPLAAYFFSPTVNVNGKFLYGTFSGVTV